MAAFGRDRAGNFQFGPFVEGGPALGAGFSLDTVGVEFVRNIDQLDRSLSINSVLGAGVINGKVFRMLQKCPVCGVSLARVPIEFFGVKLQIYTLLTPRRCPNGHPLDRRASESA